MAQVGATRFFQSLGLSNFFGFHGACCGINKHDTLSRILAECVLLPAASVDAFARTVSDLCFGKWEQDLLFARLDLERGVGESDPITKNIKKMQVLQGPLRFEGQNYVTRFPSRVDDKILS